MNLEAASRPHQAFGFAVCLALCFVTSATGALASVHARSFYAELARPVWAPPGWLFGPVWTLLFLTMKAAGASFSAKEAVCLSSPPVQVSLLPGTALSRRALTYNPAFTDWMMGWPRGWTACEEPVTEFAAWLRRMRGALSQLPCAAKIVP